MDDTRIVGGDQQRHGPRVGAALHQARHADHGLVIGRLVVPIL
jgi:hypothetical protein